MTARSLVLALLVLAAPAAHAQDAAEGELAQARALFTSAREHLEAGSVQDADALFSRALALHDAPSIRWNLAITRAQLGRLVDAREHLRAAFRGFDEGDPRRGEAIERIAELDARIAEVTFEVETVPEGLAVTLDGEPLRAASFGFPRPLDPGSHRLTASAPDHAELSVDFAVREGESRRVTVALEALAAPTDAWIGEAERAARDAQPILAVPAEAFEASAEPRDVTDEWWLWTLIGAGAASLIAGVIVAIVVETSSGAPLPGGPIETRGGECE